ncbi:SpoIIE family protein phosphatase [Planosporangium flavigriseum]|uniref:Transcription antitermination regulator n=1 Tax=Planosporangium flavigriseum TaxID=373681 RepID=A0A8J3LRJ0_9ACTN|nr:SpoIIE family protein phosphatase [Planosporangium flavigriseum]NJC63411.1 SpoIIE family protein phosphatase [Planosporangium flavigriseum]GIG76717.1 transcription antitermination regulator [Planosporangium flavigriseum]
MRQRPDEPGSAVTPGPVDEAHAPEPNEALAALVTKLRTELAGVRTAMRNRAVIEQAKGVLVERLGVTPDAAFDHLLQLSQRANIKLVEVAASVVGATAPDPQAAPVTTAPARQPGGASKIRRPGPGASAPGKNRPPAHEALQARHQLISSRIAASGSFDEAAEAIGTAAASWPGPATVLITLVEPAGAHRLAGAYGMSAHARRAWQQVPPQVAVPITRAARDRTALLVTDSQEIADQFPDLADQGLDAQAVFAAPLLDGDRVIGTLGLSWERRVDLDADTNRYLSALAEPVARKAAELAARATASPAGTDEDSATWLPIVLETLVHPAAVLAPVWADGQVVDFRIEHANTAAAELISPARAGQDATLLTAYPRVGSELLLPGLVGVLHSGGPRRLGPARLSPTAGADPAISQVMTADASRVWDRAVMVWRVHDESELIHSQLLDAERIARIGSFRWELERAEPHCSPQLYRMYFGDGQRHPVRVGELAGCVHSDDLPALQDAVKRTLVGGEQLSWEVRGAGRLAGHRLHIVAQPELDGAGIVTAIRGTVQDVTNQRVMESRLRRAEVALTTQRRRVDAELEAAQALQRTLLPSEPELGATEGLWVTGRCRNSADPGRVDGDWYDACALPGGASLLVVGDVAGSGLAAMTTAARLRYAVRAYAALDMSPGEILSAVNTMLCVLEPERTATLVVARYEAQDHQLRWASAGQAAPVRYRGDGRAELLPGPLGLPVGVVAQVTYSDTALELASGDRLLLYTDSLVGTRGTDLVSALDVLLGAGAHVGSDDVEAVVSHVVESLQMGRDADMGAMLVRVTN